MAHKRYFKEGDMLPTGYAINEILTEERHSLPSGSEERELAERALRRTRESVGDLENLIGTERAHDAIVGLLNATAPELRSPDGSSRRSRFSVRTKKSQQTNSRS